MNKNDKQHALVPRLRFPEFQNSEGWAKETLGAIVTLEYGSSLPAKDRTGDGFPVVGSNGIVGHHRIATVPGPAIIVGRKGSVGQINLIEDNCTPIDTTFHAVLKRPNQDHFYFVWRLLESARLYTFGDAGAVPGLNRNDAHARPTAIPGSAEQQKIADCLGSLDDLIAAEGRKLAALRDHKKGLMQQLFPREGETRPRLRFPEFQDAPDWDERPFGDYVAHSFYGTSKSTTDSGTYPVLRMGNMEGGGLDFSDLVYIELDDAEFASLQLKTGDILLNRTNSYELVGKVSMFDKADQFVAASYLVTYRVDEDRLVSSFCNAMLNTPQYQRRIKVLATKGVSQANINPTTFKTELVVAVPELAEQQLIADCLSALDALIIAQSEKLDALRAHKRGLMQQLFPSPEDFK